MAFGQGGLVEALLKAVRERTQLAVQRNDFKLEQLPAHLFMNFRVLDEHGRQLAQARDLASLKAELGTQARSAFQALAALKLSQPQPAQTAAPLPSSISILTRSPKRMKGVAGVPPSMVSYMRSSAMQQ